MTKSHRDTKKPTESGTSVKARSNRRRNKVSKERTPATPKEIAEWMVARINRYGKLLQVKAVIAIQDKFGAEFVYVSDIGELSIDRRILYQFRKLSGDKIVWFTHHGGGFWPKAHWRKREPGDAPGRTQYEY
jgi:hypothetical protein